MYVCITGHAPLPPGGAVRGDDTLGNHHRAQLCQFELFELVISLKVYTNTHIERFEATVSQSTVPSPPLKIWKLRPDGIDGTWFGKLLPDGAQCTSIH